MIVERLLDMTLEKTKDTSPTAEAMFVIGCTSSTSDDGAAKTVGKHGDLRSRGDLKVRRINRTGLVFFAFGHLLTNVVRIIVLMTRIFGSDLKFDCGPCLGVRPGAHMQVTHKADVRVVNCARALSRCHSHASTFTS
jgi:hypothetical protein